MDTGTFFENETSFGDKPYLSTIEPRLFYVYIPYVNQNNIPVFDSSSYDTTYYQLFRENWYTGYDRVSNANDVTAAVTTKLIDSSTGLERLRATVGNRAYFSGQQVTLTGLPTSYQSQGYSNIVADLGSAITHDWSFYSGGQYNVPFSSVERAQAGFIYNNRKNQILNLAYRYRLDQYSGLPCPLNNPNSDCLNLTDISGRLPLIDNWYAVGRWEYSLLNRITLDSFFGIEKETCCWRFAVLGRHYLNSITSPTATQPTVTGSATNTVFLQLELKGFSVLGDQIDQFLERTITGYRYSGY
jgi:LPS-assembly protein